MISPDSSIVRRLPPPSASFPWCRPCGAGYRTSRPKCGSPPTSRRHEAGRRKGYGRDAIPRSGAMAPGSPPCIRRLPLIAGAAREESSQSLQCTGFRRRPPTPMSSGAACPFRSSPNSGLYTAAISDIAESVTSDPGRCSMPSTTMISTTKRTCSKMRPRCHVCPPNCLGITTERRRSADAARRSWWAHRRAWTGTRSHVWAAMDNRAGPTRRQQLLNYVL